MSRVLVVAAHPDDEAIGCGGTLRRHALDGDEVDVVFLTSGEAGMPGNPPAETALCREQEARAAADVLGVKRCAFWHEPDGRLRATPRLVARLAADLTADPPRHLYVTYRHDSHPDHRAAARAAVAAVRQATLPRPPITFMTEVWTPVRRIDAVIDISDVLADKLAAIRCYQSQLAQMRFDSAAEALARYRGEMHSWPGGDYAEVFTKVHW